MYIADEARIWHRLAAAGLILPLAWEFPYAAGSASKRRKKKKQQQKTRKPRVTSDSKGKMG